MKTALNLLKIVLGTSGTSWNRRFANSRGCQELIGTARATRIWMKQQGLTRTNRNSNSCQELIGTVKVVRNWLEQKRLSGTDWNSKDCQELHITAWSYLKLLDTPWSYLKLHGTAWNCLKLLKTAWNQFKLLDTPWNCPELLDETSWNFCNFSTAWEESEKSLWKVCEAQELVMNGSA